MRQNHFFFRFDKNQCGVKGLGTCNTLKKKKENKKICKLYILSTDIWLYILQINRFLRNGLNFQLCSTLLKNLENKSVGQGLKEVFSQRSSMSLLNLSYSEQFYFTGTRNNFTRNIKALHCQPQEQ